MQLAVNYSDAALDLHRRGRLPVDRFKCPDWPDRFDEFLAGGPIYIHFRYMAGTGAMGGQDLDTAARMRARSGTPYANLHIAPYLHEMEHQAEWNADPSDATLERLLRRDIARLTGRFGAENVLIESAPHFDTDGTIARPGVDPAFIRRIVHETGTLFLLDLSHARIAASQLGVPEREYVEALPLDRLGEMHVTGLEMEQGILSDHYAMSEADWPSLEWAVGEIRAGRWAEPWVMTFEYGGVGSGYAERTDPAVLEEQVGRMRRMMNS